ncbi:MAG TPA: DNA-binding response regulator [Verrucomicrobia bacterium]|nr:DNA-binding response regulator [Verrucomicrobiota bacterium]
MAIKIMLADDHKMIRAGLRALIEKQENMQVVAEASDGQTAVRLARKLAPDVVVMDVGMPDLNGIEATRQIVGLPHQPRVIGLSMYSDCKYVTQMLKAGASGYLLKNNAFEELVRAIETVMKKKTYLSSEISNTVVDEYRRIAQDKDGSAYALLTEREREILQQMAEGCSTKEIAGALGISDKTVETHRRNIMDKLNIFSVANLTKYAIKEGLTDL